MRPRRPPGSSRFSIVAVVAVASASLGCPTPQTRAGRAQEAASEYNLNARFGRMELAVEHVAQKEREAFAGRHRAWGERIRIADTELAGMRMVAEEEAEVVVKVAWYRIDQDELHVTTLRQTWRDHKGEWLLEAETRADGDPGLLGDAVVISAPAPTQAQFPTIRIGAPR